MSRLHLGSISAVPRLYLGCTSAISRLYLGYISAISRLYLGRISAVSRLCLGHISAVSRLRLEQAAQRLIRQLRAEAADRDKAGRAARAKSDKAAKRAAARHAMLDEASELLKEAGVRDYLYLFATALVKQKMHPRCMYSYRGSGRWWSCSTTARRTTPRARRCCGCFAGCARARCAPRRAAS